MGLKTGLFFSVLIKTEVVFLLTKLVSKRIVSFICVLDFNAVALLWLNDL